MGKILKLISQILRVQQTLTDYFEKHKKEQKTINISTELINTLKTTDVEETQQRTMISMRENFQYGTETSVKEKQLEELKKLSRQAIEETKNIIYE